MKRWFCILLFSFAVLICQAQGSSTLFRGRYPSAYPFRYNGTFFLENREFGEGNLMYNGKLYQDILMNFDAYKQELQLIPEKTAPAVVIYREQIAWFRWKDRLFVNLRYLGYEDAPAGFFELLKDGEIPVLKQCIKEFISTTKDMNGEDGIGYYDPQYDITVPNCFVKKEVLYAIKSGKAEKIRKREYKRLMTADSVKEVITPMLDEWHAEVLTDGIISQSNPGLKGITLPDGYFEEIKQEDTLTVEYTESVQQASFRNKIYVIGDERPGRKRARLKGTVAELESGLPLHGAIVFDENTKNYARTDSRGRYSLDLPLGENLVHFIYETKEPLDLQVDVKGDGTLDVQMTDQIILLKEVVISASSMEKHRSTGIGIENVNIRTIGKIPSAFGEGDVLKAVTTLPGIKSVGEASGGFNVRGGGADENLILFNENTIYNPSHLFGIFSSFNPDVIENVEVFKSSVPAEYGGRLSSVMKVDGKEGNTERIHASLGIGVLTSRGHIEGPLVKGKTTFVAGARTTYSDWILKKLPSSSAYSGAQAGFWDANASLTHRFSSKDALQLSAYYASDRFALANQVNNSYSNLNASVIFRHRDASASSWKIAAGYDSYKNFTGDHSWNSGAYDLTTGIQQVFAKGSWERVFGKHKIQAGANVLAYIMQPGIMSPFGEESHISEKRMPLEYGIEPSAFISDLFTISDAFSLEGGIRLSSFVHLEPSKTYAAPEFRLSGKYSPSRTLSFKAGFSTMQQYIHLISNTTGISPMDTWKLSDAAIRPSNGFQTSAGVYWTHVNWGLDFSAEVYWKESRNALDYKPGAVLSMNEKLSDDLAPVRNRSYGIELMVKKPAGKLTGWISYSYSRSRFKEMEDRGNATIAGGNWYNTSYDKPHELKMVANWAITHRFSLSANVDYSTGRPVTVPLGRYWYKGAYRMAYSERNVHRIPDYFRVDLALNIDPGHYLKAFVHSSITIGVYNVLGRKNPYSVYFTTDAAGNIEGHMLSVFATQVPYINLNILF